MSPQLLELDVTDDKSLARACESVTSATGGRLHLLVNNAGRGLVSPILTASLSDIRSMMDTNYLGLIACTQTFGPLLIRTASSEHASGSTWRPKVVNIGSVAGIQPVPWSGLYSSSKGAVHRLSDALRLELKGFGVDVVVIAPGVIKTGFAGNVASYGESTKDNNKELEEELYPNLPAILERRKQLLYGGYRSEADEWAAEQVEVMTRSSAPAYYISGAKSWIAAYAVPYLPTWVIDFFTARGNACDMVRYQPKQT